MTLEMACAVLLGVDAVGFGTDIVEARSISLLNKAVRKVQIGSCVTNGVLAASVITNIIQGTVFSNAIKHNREDLLKSVDTLQKECIALNSKLTAIEASIYGVNGMFKPQ